MSNKTTCTSAGTGTPVTTQTICNRPFIAYEHGIGDQLDPFAWNVIEGQLRERLTDETDKTFPNQKYTSLCGPVAFFYCLQIKHPALYRIAVQQLWQTGEAQIARLIIKPKDACKRPKDFFYDNNTPRILGIDWMTLAGLRSSSNWVFSYDSPDESIFNKTLAATTPLQLDSWFVQAGFRRVDDKIITNFRSVQAFITFNEYYHKKYCIVALIDSDLLSDLAKISLPTHWVVWTSTLNDKNGNPITNNLKDSDIVKLTVFSWGKNKYFINTNVSFDDFRNHVYKVFVYQ
ncbi:hypothetical protein LP122_10605 [Moraxella bovis]|uniref:hypothetical protein n=1 Tax=Moraxella bovis TaxID=476 RepID=UPI0022264FCC|nr:hypothetical protein [Moraxella bovis]UYZ68192.1 hypothetical protein LP122_10605 [Moraxella bovis]